MFDPAKHVNNKVYGRQTKPCQVPLAIGKLLPALRAGNNNYVWAFYIDLNYELIMSHGIEIKSYSLVSSDQSVAVF